MPRLLRRLTRLAGLPGSPTGGRRAAREHRPARAPQNWLLAGGCPRGWGGRRGEPPGGWGARRGGQPREGRGREWAGRVPRKDRSGSVLQDQPLASWCLPARVEGGHSLLVPLPREVGKMCWREPRSGPPGRGPAPTLGGTGSPLEGQAGTQVPSLNRAGAWAARSPRDAEMPQA